MPIYDVSCSNCAYESSINLKISELESWDKSASCPQCTQAEGSFRRVIKHVAVATGPRDNWSRYASKSREPDKVAAAFESVRTGANEGFK